MAKLYYVYMLHESPVEPPFYCKVGFTDHPQRRLAQLQAGNPRALRTWSQSRRPNGTFGLPMPSRRQAIDFEKRLFDRFHEMGIRLRRDYDYEKDRANIREWIETIQPDDLWILMLVEYEKFINERRIAHLVAPQLVNYQLTPKEAAAQPAQ